MQWMSLPALFGAVSSATRTVTRVFRKQPVAPVDVWGMLNWELGETVKVARNDSQARITVNFLTARILMTNLHFEVSSDAQGDKPLLKVVCDHLNNQLDRQRGFLIEGFVEFGRYAYSIKSSNSEVDGVTATLWTPDYIEAYRRDVNGCYAKFSSRKFVEDDKADNFGEFLGVVVHDGRSADPIDPKFCGWMAFKGTTAHPEGVSIYSGAPQLCLDARKEILDIRRRWVKKCLIGLRTVHAPEVVTDPNTGEEMDNWSAMATELAAARNFGYMFLPPDRDSSGDRVYDIGPEPEVKDASGLEEVITNMDAEMSRALGIHEDLVGQSGSGGSNAYSQIVLQTADGLADLYASSLCSALESDWVKKHAESNGFRPEDIKCVRRRLLGQDGMDTKVAASVLTNAAVTPIISSGAVDVVALLRMAGVPLTEDAKEKLALVLKTIYDSTVNSAASQTTTATADPSKGTSGRVPAVGDGQPMNGGTGNGAV